MEMLKVAYEQSKKLLIENREILDELASFLIERETITGKEFMEIFHRLRAEKGIEPPADFLKKQETPAEAKTPAEEAVQTETKATADETAQTEQVPQEASENEETKLTDSETLKADDIGNDEDPKDLL